uniref:Trafficking protein particle complex subunit 13 n=1 Tax=Calcidiscus leptoporus TaxID=127549 RepID=A0A7S0NNI5_9EUKA
MKVMRLCKPTFLNTQPVPFSGMAQSSGQAPPAPSTSGNLPTLHDDDCAISGMLMLPQSFGDIFLGETFSCYISLTNISPVELNQMGLKVEVQTQLQRETLSDSSIPEAGSVRRFAPGQTLDRIIRYELKDLGIHILICSALYADSYGGGKYFRKFFKFQVQNPLSMKSKTHSLAAHNEILVETQLQNATSRPLFLESVSFIPSAQFDVEPLTNFDAAVIEAAPLECSESAAMGSNTDASSLPPVGLPAFGHMAYLKAGDTQQHMYRLRGKQPPWHLRTVAALGRMEVVWKAQMGESGHLQSNTVQRKLPTSAARAIEVNVLVAPQQVVVETPFEVSVSINNTTSRERSIALRFDSSPANTNAIVLDGASGRSLGTLKANSSQNATLNLIALEPGMHKIVGLQLVDSLADAPIDVGPLADLLVLEP